MPNHWLGIFFVGCIGFEPMTPALSRQCSKPAELTALTKTKLSKFYIMWEIVPLSLIGLVVQWIE